jgi:hypothetical protein
MIYYKPLSLLLQRNKPMRSKITHHFAKSDIPVDATNEEAKEDDYDDEEPRA